MKKLFPLLLVILPLMFLPLAIRKMNNKDYASIKMIIYYFGDYEPSFSIETEIEDIKDTLSLLTPKDFNVNYEQYGLVHSAVMWIVEFFSNLGRVIVGAIKIVFKSVVNVFTFSIYMLGAIPFYIGLP